MTHVLVLEDDEDVRSMLLDMLASAGFTTDQAADGATALKLVRERGCDVLLTDLLMPGVDGIEVIKSVRQVARPPAIIAISGGSPILPAAVGLGLSEAFGADRVLYKPFSKAELVQAITTVLAARQPKA